MGVQAAGLASFNSREPRSGLSRPPPAAPAPAPQAGAVGAGKGECVGGRGVIPIPGGGGRLLLLAPPASAGEVGTAH